MDKKFHYLPEVTTGINADAHVTPQKTEYPCPCCGYFTFPVPQNQALAYICPVCYWENDLFINDADEKSDENHGLTLNEAQKNYKKFGAVRPDFLKYVRNPLPDEMP